VLDRLLRTAYDRSSTLPQDMLGKRLSWEYGCLARPGKDLMALRRHSRASGQNDRGPSTEPMVAYSRGNTGSESRSLAMCPAGQQFLT
jgi:hypothetical protein